MESFFYYLLFFNVLILGTNRLDGGLNGRPLPVNSTS